MRPASFPRLLAFAFAFGVAAALAAPAPTLAGSGDPPLLGVRVEAGVPGGATASVVLQPVPSLRLLAGPAWDYVGWGLQGGVAWLPLDWPVAPVIEADYGRFFAASRASLASRLGSGAPPQITAIAEHLGFDYAAATAGLEIGSPSGVALSLRAGLAYLWGTVHGSTSVVSGAGTAGQTTVTATDPRLSAVVPTVALGLVVHF